MRPDCRFKRGYGSMEIIIMLAVLAGLALLAIPAIKKARAASDLVKVRDEMQELCHELKNFQAHMNGQFPSDITAGELRARFPQRSMGAMGGKHANAYFRQLGYFSPAKDFSTSDFSYVMPRGGFKAGHSGNWRTPLLMSRVCPRENALVTGADFEIDTQRHKGSFLWASWDGAVHITPPEQTQVTHKEQERGRLVADIFPKDKEAKPTSANYLILTPEG